MDTDLIWFAVRMWNLQVTDLMQGLFGVETDETAIDPKLQTIFNYDEIFDHCKQIYYASSCWVSTNCIR